MKARPGFLPEALSRDAHEELVKNILPYWMKRMPDRVNGGFHGRIDGHDRVVAGAPRGAILYARILWTFSAAYFTLGNPEYLRMAKRARDYIMGHFVDDQYGGTYWSVSADGDKPDTRKQIYSLAFFIYAFSWHYRATGDRDSLQMAVSLFNTIEDHSFDSTGGGYLEAFARDWSEIADQRLSDKDANEKKTMNTHLHLLEAYTSLYGIWPEKVLHDKLNNLLNIFLRKIIDANTGHLILFFDEGWGKRSSMVSYGHDIEASWLIREAAKALGREKEVTGSCMKVVVAAMEGLAADGGLKYERDDSRRHVDDDRHWWVQAEAVVGLINAWEVSGKSLYLDLALKVYDYISSNLIDTKNGEWYWSIRADGTVNRDDDKAGFWKCPYHNTRMCLEIMRRTQKG